jgi:hypothetical protein
LEHLVSRSQGVTLWRGEDPALGRTVAITVIAADDPRAESVAAAARDAASLEARALVRILDVVTTPEHVMIVCEWVSGRTLADTYESRDGEPLGAVAAARMAVRVASALADVHATGRTHGRLRPSSVLMTQDDEVRVRGVGIDAALWGSSANGIVADIHGVGSLLYAGLTGRWPDGMVDGVAAAPRSGDHILLPSQVTAEVPATMDVLVARSVIGAGLVRGAVPFTQMRDFADALRVSQGHIDVRRTSRALPLQRRSRPQRTFGRMAGVATSLVIVGAVCMFGMITLTNAASPWGTADQASVREIFTKTASPTPLAISGTDGPAGTYIPVNASVFDPFTIDPGSKSNPKLAIDGSDLTEWKTGGFTTSDLDGNRGTGIVLDLGSARSVSAVSLKLVGNGSSVQVRLSSTIFKDPAKWTELARAVGAANEIDLRAPRPVVGQYVLLWFTGLPLADTGSYVGGIREALVRG